MTINLRFESPFTQYIIGLCINLLVVVLLISSKVTYNNIQIPEGQYKNNIWKGNDTYSYVKMSRNYIHYGVVGEGNIPTMSRTVGYPIYLALMMKLFGKNWPMVLFFLQAVLFAFIYPTITKIIQLFFGNNKKLITWTFLFLLLSGAYFSSVTVILTDTIFAVFLTFGIYFGLATIVKKNWIYFLFHILFIGLAGQIRPILFLYAIPNLFVLIAIAKKHNKLGDRKIRSIIVISSILILIVCNLPTLRNYLNYGVITPATVLQNNLFGTHATKILFEKKQNGTINELYSQIDTTKVLSKKLGTEVKNAIEIFKEYPLATIQLYISNIAKMSVKNYYNEFSHFWGVNWRNMNNKNHYPFQKSNIVFLITILFGAIYSIINLLMASFLIRLIKMKKYFYLVSLLIFIIYFISPVGFVGSSIRFRMPIEGFILMFSLFELLLLSEKKFWFRKTSIVTIQK